MSRADENDLVVVATAATPEQAHLMQATLKYAGIESAVLDDNSTYMMPFASLGVDLNRVRVAVRRGDCAAARAALEEPLPYEQDDRDFGSVYVSDGFEYESSEEADITDEELLDDPDELAQAEAAVMDPRDDEEHEAPESSTSVLWGLLILAVWFFIAFIILNAIRC